MQITLTPSAISPALPARHQFLTSYQVNGLLAIDAGCLGFSGNHGTQASINHVFISHTHMDHIASLPAFLEDLDELRMNPVTIYGSEAVFECLRQDIFNGRVWPDLFALSRQSGPFFHSSILEAGRPVDVGNMRITPVPVDHVVPTFGFILEDSESTVVIASDTGPTEEIWQRANRMANLRAVFLEVTFPNVMAELAGVAKHLTPALFAAEARKLTRPARIIATHIRPRSYAQVIRELEAIEMPNLEIAEYGKTYTF